MEEKKTEVDEQRRSVLKKMAVGTGFLAGCAVLPERWTTPIVGQIVLPAHAAPSGCTISDPCTVTISAGDQTTATVTALVTGFVTPPTANVPIHLVATATGGSGASATGDTTTDAGGNYSQSLTVSGGPGITEVAVASTSTVAVGTARCSAPTAFVPPALISASITSVFDCECINTTVSVYTSPPVANIPIQVALSSSYYGINKTLSGQTDGNGHCGVTDKTCNQQPAPDRTLTQDPTITATITSTGASGILTVTTNVTNNCM